MNPVSYNDVVFPKVSISNMSTFRNGNRDTRFRQLSVKKPRNFVFNDVTVANLKNIKNLFEDQYIMSIKERFIQNFFLMNETETRKYQEQNCTLFHQLYSLLEEHILLIEKLQNLKKSKKQRYRRNKREKERKEKEDWKRQYSPTRGLISNNEDGGVQKRVLYHVEIVPINNGIDTN
jgi:hypothetical protein